MVRTLILAMASGVRNSPNGPGFLPHVSADAWYSAQFVRYSAGIAGGGTRRGGTRRSGGIVRASIRSRQHRLWRGVHNAFSFASPASVLTLARVGSAGWAR